TTRIHLARRLAHIRPVTILAMTKRTPLLLVVAVMVVSLAAFRLHAQQTISGPSFLLTPEQARAFLGPDRGEPRYVPGQTLVKFRGDTGPAEQTRALSAVRRDTDGANTRWIGDVLLVTTPNNADAAAIASTLSRQPEVEWAQPN